MTGFEAKTTMRLPPLLSARTVNATSLSLMECQRHDDLHACTESRSLRKTVHAALFLPAH
jgi:hypothetical protein